MTLKGADLGKYFMTLLTAIGLFSGVNSLVDFYITLASKPLITLVTFKGSLTAMSAFVSDEMTLA